MSFRVVMVPEGVCVVRFEGRGRSLVQCSPIAGPDCAELSVLEMAEGTVVKGGCEVLVGVVVGTSSIASDSGLRVARAGSDILRVLGIELCSAVRQSVQS